MDSVTAGREPRKMRGAYLEGGKWTARIQGSGQKRYLGAFREARHAALAWDAEARRLGRAAEDLNFPDETASAAQIEQWRLPGRGKGGPGAQGKGKGKRGAAESVAGGATSGERWRELRALVEKQRQSEAGGRGPSRRWET